MLHANIVDLGDDPPPIRYKEKKVIDLESYKVNRMFSTQRVNFMNTDHIRA